MLFNGTYTVINLETGTHKTFKVKTQSLDATFAPGERILSIMNGKDNENDYLSLGFVKDNGIVVWKKHRGTQFETLANFVWNVMNTNKYDGRVSVEISKKCRVCNRKLTTPESLESGIGPVCEGR